jgi:hypothetical protein
MPSDYANKRGAPEVPSAGGLARSDPVAIRNGHSREATNVSPFDDARHFSLSRRGICQLGQEAGMPVQPGGFPVKLG